MPAGETPDWNQPLPLPTTLGVTAAALAAEAISTWLTVGGTAGRSIVVTNLGLSTGRLDVPSQGLRTLVQAVMTDNLVAFLDQITIGPDMPSFSRGYTPGAVFCAVGNALAVQVLTEPGGGSQLCTIHVEYFLQ